MRLPVLAVSGASRTAPRLGLPGTLRRRPGLLTGASLQGTFASDFPLTSAVAAVCAVGSLKTSGSGTGFGKKSSKVPISGEATSRATSATSNVPLVTALPLAPVLSRGNGGGLDSSRAEKLFSIPMFALARREESRAETGMCSWVAILGRSFTELVRDRAAGGEDAVAAEMLGRGGRI